MTEKSSLSPYFETASQVLRAGSGQGHVGSTGGIAEREVVDQGFVAALVRHAAALQAADGDVVQRPERTEAGPAAHGFGLPCERRVAERRAGKVNSGNNGLI
jgi:hypothetical protein